jgi:hypothetical protein
MAAWQVDFAIVPRRALVHAGGTKTQPATDVDWWKADALPSNYQGKLAAVASPASSQSEELQSWGVEDGNRVDVWSVAGRVTTVTARVDVRKLDAKFAAMLLQFVRMAGAVLVRHDGLVVEPIVGAFAAALRSSDAWRFANDPAAFLASYSDVDPEDA